MTIIDWINQVLIYKKPWDYFSDSDKKHLTNKLTEFVKDEIIGDGMSGENLSAALQFH